MKKLVITTLFWSIFSISFAQHVLKGKVKNQSGDPLPSANVQLKILEKATSTDENGNFVFPKVPAGKRQIQISYIGYKTHVQSIEVNRDVNLSFELEEEAFINEEVVVYSTRANEKTPTTYSNFSKQKIEERNLGQDLPILVNFTPSVVATSDAGAGIGYTGMRIRGSDATRINVTVNGVPINDSESHGVFWVNMPDLSSSLSNIQIQRGVGTSSNGAAAFGATVNLQTNTVSKKSFVEINNTFGSFNTVKNNIILNSGLLKDRFNFEGRVSRITSDGYIDRSSSNLKSYYFSGGYFGEKTMLKAIVFGGKEITQQAWYGTPEARLNGNQEKLQEVIELSGEYDTPQQIDNLLNSDRRFNYYLYDNEVDNYSQDHYQLHFSYSISEHLNLNTALHYTYGSGYFEQFKYDDDFSDYGLGNLVIGDSTITSSDIIRRRWLDNDFYGLTYSLNYSKNNIDLTLGGGYNIYDGDHFGEIIWSEFANGTDIRDRYYDGVGEKRDFNTYLKVNYQLNDQLNLFGDLQVRTISYETSGSDNDHKVYDVNTDFTFFNPKFGLTYALNKNMDVYASYAIGNREPIRSDFIDAAEGTEPKQETMQNVEGGVRGKGNNLHYSANIYWMDYKNQLVLTGEVNDVGASVRTNVPDSYRMGVELVGYYQITPNLSWGANLTLSQNKIKEFTETVYDYAFAGEESIIRNEFQDTDISFSPNIVGSSEITWKQGGFTAQLLSKYVGKQYLDNTNNEDRAIDSYFTNDFRLSYGFSTRNISRIEVNLLVNNIFNRRYSSNGYTWGYLFDGSLYQQNNYYPQAERNFLVGLKVRI